jgi:hypothetical protein
MLLDRSMVLYMTEALCLCLDVQCTVLYHMNEVELSRVGLRKARLAKAERSTEQGGSERGSRSNRTGRIV